MKKILLGYLLSALLIPTLSMAQTAQLTEQLGKTVLYGDIALSPDGAHVAWVQSTAATTSKQTYVRSDIRQSALPHWSTSKPPTNGLTPTQLGRPIPKPRPVFSIAGIKSRSSFGS